MASKKNLAEAAEDAGLKNPHPDADEQRRIALEAEQPAIQAEKHLKEGDEEAAMEALKGNTKGFVDPDEK